MDVNIFSTENAIGKNLNDCQGLKKIQDMEYINVTFVFLKTKEGKMIDELVEIIKMASVYKIYPPDDRIKYGEEFETNVNVSIVNYLTRDSFSGKNPDLFCMNLARGGERK